MSLKGVLRRSQTIHARLYLDIYLNITAFPCMMDVVSSHRLKELSEAFLSY